MSVEPGVVDANILIYSLNADASQHAASHALLAAANNPSVTLYVTSQIIPASVANRLLELLKRRPVTAAGIFDLQIVATMQANNIERIYTFNEADFQTFPELTVIRP